MEENIKKVRNLKYYSWIFDKGYVYLICKKVGGAGSMRLSMPMADSFVRAYISFKNAQRINEKGFLKHKIAVLGNKITDLRKEIKVSKALKKIRNTPVKGL